MQDYLSPERQKIALLTIDAQRDFTLPGAPATVSGSIAATSQMRQLTEGQPAEIRLLTRPDVVLAAINTPDRWRYLLEMFLPFGFLLLLQPRMLLITLP
ncbi:MAG: hypothetical protein HC829_01430, partial [Bacteroidales bacterium]|nr:hypothetical protein [Bacteroidales bacterium]